MPHLLSPVPKLVNVAPGLAWPGFTQAALNRFSLPLPAAPPAAVHLGV